MNQRHLILTVLILVLPFMLFSQTFTISGLVVSGDVNEPAIGANVSVKGSTIGTITDFDGNFTLNVKKGDYIVVSYIGYETQIIQIKSEEFQKIVLQADNLMLDEVVAIGYGVVKKSDLTGSVSTVKADQLQKTPASGVDQALQGRAAGVTVNANSGQPGAAAEVRIRGIGTINDSSPLFVVDGVMVNDISFLSPSDIESTEILKDASATAIYGSRGANGVILIQTRKGQEGKANISFGAYWGIQNRWNKLDLMQSKEMAETMIAMAGVASEQNFYKEKGFNQWLSAYRLGRSEYYPINYDYASIETDWQDAVFNPNALIHNYNISIDGGSDKGSYSISSSYFDQDGTIIGSDYRRLTIRVNSIYTPRKWLRIGENISYVHSGGRTAMNNSASAGASILSAALAMAPWDPTHYAEGAVNNEGKDLSGQIAASSNFKNVVNPFSMVQTSHPINKGDRFVGDVYLEILPVKGLVIRSDVSMDLNFAENRLYKESYEFSSFDKADKNYISSSLARSRQFMVENTITYSNEINDHDFSVMVGQTTQQDNYYSVSGSGASILNPTENNWYLNQATDDRTESSDGASRSRRLSFLGRIHYSYASRYIATINFRADASSKFPQHPWGYFPSVALAWRMNEESWMKDFSALDNLKIRGGWGQIGNDKVGNDSFITTMFNSGPTFVDYVLGGTQALANGATVLTQAIKDGKWETTEQWNVAVDFGFWNGLLSGSVDLYTRKTLDMILPITAPAHVGNRYDPSRNIGNVRNRGIEITLDHQNRVGKFSYGISGNVSFVENRLTAVNGGSPIYGDVTLCDEGLPLFTFWGYEYEGIYQSDSEAWQHLWSYSNFNELPYHRGDAKFKDQNNDGKIDDGDKVNLGNPFPWLTYGLNFNAEYYGVDLQLFFQGVAGNEIYNAVRIRTEGKGTEATLGVQMREVWTIDNLDGTIPNPYGNSNNYATSSRFVEKGDYLRLKNLQIGYTLPVDLTKRASINRLRFYVSASNLFTITQYTGYDPEVGGGVDYGNYPQSRTFTFGLNVDF